MLSKPKVKVVGATCFKERALWKEVGAPRGVCVLKYANFFKVPHGTLKKQDG